MVLDKLPSDVRKAGGVARTASIRIIEDIMNSVTIPVMAKCRIGHVNEALVLQETNVDMIDESEVLTPADELHHIWKWDFTTPVVNGARSLAEALRRIEEFIVFDNIGSMHSRPAFEATHQRFLKQISIECPGPLLM